MDKENQKKFEIGLQEEKAHLEEAIAELGKTPNFGNDVDGFEEEADEAEELSNRLGEEASFKERLARINEALSRIEKGSYGICEKCGNQIEQEVLEASPESTLCKACKASV